MYECFCLRRCQDRPEHDDGAGPTSDGAAGAIYDAAAAASDAGDDAREHDAGSPLSYVCHIISVNHMFERC